MDVLTKEKWKTYDKISRYSVFPVYYHTIDSRYIHGTTSYLREDTPYQVYTALGNETFDLLALKYYNNPTFYWVICSFNRIQDPFIKLNRGDKIKIPTLSGIEFEV